MKTILSLIFFTLICCYAQEKNQATVLFRFVDDVYFPPLPKINSVKEFRQSVDSSMNFVGKKWLSSERIYYPNGQLHQIITFKFDGDTLLIQKFRLSKDSLIESYSRKRHSTWYEGYTYHYKEGERQPYASTLDQVVWEYFYDKNGNVYLKSSGHGDTIYQKNTYYYNEDGLIVKEIDIMDIYGDGDQIVNIYIHEYEQKSGGIILRKTFKERTYNGISNTKTLWKETYYNDKGERLKMIYFIDNKPSTLWTYEYKYY